MAWMVPEMAHPSLGQPDGTQEVPREGNLPAVKSGLEARIVASHSQIVDDFICFCQLSCN